jgi:hypothetical protein
MSGIFLVTVSGSSVARKLTTLPARRVVAVHPYHVIFGPSPLLAASHPKTMRFVAGWKVNSGQLKKRQTM